MKALRGRPKSGSKKLLVSTRNSPGVVAYFRSAGEGWPSRMDGALQPLATRGEREADPLIELRS